MANSVVGNTAETMTTHKLILLAAVIAGALVVNFVPTIIAYATRHPERRRLAAINPLSIVSFLLWAALLVWAIGGRRDDSVIARFVAGDRHARLIKGGIAVLVVAGAASAAWALGH